MRIRMIGVQPSNGLEAHLDTEEEIWQNILTDDDIANEMSVASTITKIMDIRRMLPRALFLDKMVERTVFEDFNTLLDEIMEDFRQSFTNQGTH